MQEVEGIGHRVKVGLGECVPAGLHCVAQQRHAAVVQGCCIQVQFGQPREDVAQRGHPLRSCTSNLRRRPCTLTSL